MDTIQTSPEVQGDAEPCCLGVTKVGVTLIFALWQDLVGMWGGGGAREEVGYRDASASSKRGKRQTAGKYFHSATIYYQILKGLPHN